MSETKQLAQEFLQHIGTLLHSCGERDINRMDAISHLRAKLAEAESEIEAWKENYGSAATERDELEQKLRDESQRLCAEIIKRTEAEERAAKAEAELKETVEKRRLDIHNAIVWMGWCKERDTKLAKVREKCHSVVYSPFNRAEEALAAHILRILEAEPTAEQDTLGARVDPLSNLIVVTPTKGGSGTTR